MFLDVNYLIFLILLKYDFIVKLTLANAVPNPFTDNIESILSADHHELLPIPAASEQKLNGLDITKNLSNENVRNNQQTNSRNSSAISLETTADTVYFIIAITGGGKLWGHTLDQLLIDIGYPIVERQRVLLKPLYINLPQNGRFSVKVLTALCQQCNDQPLAGIVIIGDGQSARAVALAGSTMKLPVLWAKGGAANLYGLHHEVQSPLQTLLQPGAKEILEGIRALFLQTHWHTFFVLCEVDASMVLNGNEGSPIKRSPLQPTILTLPANNIDVFRQLATISRSTRGIVLMLCNLQTAKRIMIEAQRLNMAGGHFIWIWNDLMSELEHVDVKRPRGGGGGGYGHTTSQLNQTTTIPIGQRQRQFGNQRNIKVHTDGLNNDEPTSNIGPINKPKRNFNYNFDAFPKGMLALRSVNMKVDRLFIRSAVRVFVTSWAKLNNDNDQLVNDDRKPINGRSRVSSGGKNSRLNVPRVRRKVNNNSMHISNKMLPIVNNSFKKPKNLNLKTSSNQNLSGLKSQSNNKSNNDTTNSNLMPFLKVFNVFDNTINLTISNKNQSNMKDLNRGRIKRQNTWWSVDNRDKTDLKKSMNNTMAQIVNGRKSLPSSSIGPNLDMLNERDSNRNAVFGTNEMSSTLNRGRWIDGHLGIPHYVGGCFGTPNNEDILNAEQFAMILSNATQSALGGDKSFDYIPDNSLVPQFELLNLMSEPVTNNSVGANLTQSYGINDTMTGRQRRKSIWKRVGTITGNKVELDTIIWPGGDIIVSGLSSRARTVFRVVTALSPPFVMESELDEDGLCLRGLPCHRLSKTGIQNLTLLFNAIETRDRLEEDAVEHGDEIPPKSEEANETYKTRCCYGLSMDLLDNIATELMFEFHLYIVRDELFGAKYTDLNDWKRNKTDSTSAHSNKPGHDLSTLNVNTIAELELEPKNGWNHKEDPGKKTKYKWNGIMGDLISGYADMSFAPLSVTRARAEVIEFSTPYFHSEVSLLAAPQTKQQIPLLAFLLPFSPELWIAIFTSLNITAVAVAVYEWFSPFGLNPWGRQRSKNFSMSSALWVMWGLLCGHLVAFKAPKSWPNKFLINVWGGFSVIFVASYTANIAALIAGLFFHNAASHYDASLLTQRVGVPVSTAAEYYVQKNDRHLWEHMKKYTLPSIEEGIKALKNNSIDLLMADSPILDYYRAVDHGCSLQRIGETYIEDSYAIGMGKGFPLRDSISTLIAKYSSNGYLDILTEKWYGGLPCFKFASDIEVVQPRPLGVAAVAGVFCLLGLGMVLGVLILIVEHVFYKYSLPILRLKPKGTVWRSRNIMFFSQKLYRFINCVELVSPHHAARELVHTLRQGQIASLFQKSIKRKEDEQRRRRKSKAQFFEMIQEIRRVQQENRETPLTVVTEVDNVTETEGAQKELAIPKPRPSPKPKVFFGRKSNAGLLNVRRFSTDSVLENRLDTIGRRLSRDISYSPPDLGKRYDIIAHANKFDTFHGSKSNENLGTDNGTLEGAKRLSGSSEELSLDYRRNIQHRPALHPDTYVSPNISMRESPLPTVVETMDDPKLISMRFHHDADSNLSSNGETSSNQRTPKIRRPKHQQARVSSQEHLDTKDCYPGGTNLKKTSKLSLERLSREDLLRLSQSSQSEIHEYLKKSIKPTEPP